MVRSLSALCATLSLCLASVASAQTTPTPTVYVAVDAVAVRGYQLTITGVVQGEQAASTKAFNINSGSSGSEAAHVETCHRLALMVMSKPGQYVLELTYYSYLTTCKLSRVTP